jgi:adenylate cyclase
MPDLVAQGGDATHRWRRTLQEGHRYILGRAAGTWSVPWDSQISRRHAEVSWRDGRLLVEKLPESQNPIFVRGRQRDSFSLRPGEHFVIGSTTFTFTSAQAQVSLDAPHPITEKSYSSNFLQNARYRYADQRIEVLCRLPELIKGAGSDEELLVRLVNVLMTGIPGASAVAIVAIVPDDGNDFPVFDSESLLETAKPDAFQANEAKPKSAKRRFLRSAGPKRDTAKPDAALPNAALPDAVIPEGAESDVGEPETGKPSTKKPTTEKPDTDQPDSSPADAPDDATQVRVLHWDRRFTADGDFAPSERLIRRAMEKQESLLYLWRDTLGPSTSAYTQTDDADWAFCTPIPGESCRGWAIYVTGKSRFRTRLPAGASDPFDLRDELKFTELAASTLSSLREVRMLERNQASLRQFFSPLVLDALAGQDPHRALSPRETEVTVLFCDLRGFSRSAEQASGHLLELLERVSQALGVMTHHILDQGGVVGDFHGDAAMGFWGWPLPQAEAIPQACRAALAIRHDFARGSEGGDDGSRSALEDFRVGIGIATGRAVAGRIGTIDQVKVTVFGPVVNLAARLETMTKRLQAPILLDEATAQRAREALTPDQARFRRVARVRPYGLQQDLEVCELLPAWNDDPTLSDDHLRAYESALDALQSGDWERAFRLLHHVPAEDRVKDFLTVFIAQHNRTPPYNWNGVIQLDSK